MKLVIGSSEKTVPYTPVEYRGDSEAPVILMKKTSLLERSQINDEVLIKMSSDNKVERFNFNETQYRLVCRQLTGWRNVVTEDGTPVKFETAEDAIELLPPEVQSELIAVFGGGYLNKEAEAKEIDKVEEAAEQAAKAEDSEGDAESETAEAA